MDGKVWGFDELWSGPLTCFDGIVRLNVTIDFTNAEADVIPVYESLAFSCFHSGFCSIYR